MLCAGKEDIGLVRIICPPRMRIPVTGGLFSLIAIGGGSELCGCYCLRNSALEHSPAATENSAQMRQEGAARAADAGSPCSGFLHCSLVVVVDLAELQPHRLAATRLDP